MNRFIARDIANVEKDFSVVEIKEEGFIDEPIKVSISEDLLHLILELNDKKSELKNGEIEIKQDSIKKNLKNVKQDDIKDREKFIGETIGSVLGSIDYSSFMKSPKVMENKIKELEAEYFFNIKELDKDEILSLYCKAVGLEETKENKNIALLALKTNEVEDEESGFSFNFFSFWFKQINHAISQQFGIKLSEEENF